MTLKPQTPPVKMKDETIIEIWFKPKDTPDVLNPSGNGFSIDVLIHCERTGEHTIGWFDYHTHKWAFLCREPVKDFTWRYLDQEVDRPLVKEIKCETKMQEQ